MFLLRQPPPTGASASYNECSLHCFTIAEDSYSAFARQREVYGL